ncbi:FAGR398Wp [Eremothecium gossypii FDAG1]|nr:FAGR398Wp [Eremothecium gossypii FDAG1]
MGSVEYSKARFPTSLDIPLRDSEEVVSIDLENDLPDDPADLKTLLVEESSDKEHWLTIAAAYCNHEMVDAGIKLIEMGLEVFHGTQSAPLYSFLTWAYLKQAKRQRLDASVREQHLMQAEQNLKNAIEFDPSWVGNMLATVDLYYQRDLYDKALETADIFIKKTQDDERRQGKVVRSNVLFLLMRAKLLYQKKNYAAALRLFQELLVLDPTLQPDPRIGIGMCFWQLRDTYMAVKAWERALQMNKNNRAASILVMLGKFRSALTDSENDERFAEQFTDVLKDLNNLYLDDKENPVLLALLQTYCYLVGDYEKVISLYQEISNWGYLVGTSVLSESAFWCGRAYYARQDYRKAFSLFQEALRKNEDNLLAKFGLGQTQIQNNLVEESILTFENIYKTQEGIQELNYILGLLYSAKCFDDGFSKLAAKEKASLVEKSISFLEKYIKLTTVKKNQLVALKAYLVLSELYELQTRYKDSLECLTKAVDQWNAANTERIPVEISNNLGCFHFINGDIGLAKKYFQDASDSIVTAEDAKTIGTTVKYNIARTVESEEPETSETMYQEILSAHAGYVQARIRTIFLKYMKTKTDLYAEELDQLLKQNESDLEVRSFYSWYIKNVAVEKTDSKGENKEIKHNRETLTKYDSHDLYALISLANMYVSIAKETKKSANPKEQDKSRQSFLKAVQLFQKVLQIDPLNIFAAQGLAIIFAESKRFGQSLDILRKVRDSLDNEDVHMNLAHCLLEMKDFVKAIENYEITITRFENIENKSTLLNLLGFAWYSRGLKEKSLDCFLKALQYTKEALALEQEKPESRLTSGFMFNVAFVEFQVAEVLRRSQPKERTLAQLEASVSGLQEAVSLLKQLASQQGSVGAGDELQQRIQLGEGTMNNALERCIKEQKEYEQERDNKLATAKKIMKEEEEKERERQSALEEEERIKRERQAEEFRRLQEEAQRLIEERASLDDLIDDSNQPPSDDDDDAHDDEKPRKKKRAKRAKRAGEPDADADATPPKKRRARARKPAVSDPEDSAPEDPKPSRGKKSAISEEFVASSDESSSPES